MRLLYGVLLLLALQACKHPLAIVGEGDIVDLNGSDFGCTLEQFEANDVACTENEVTGDYFVNYQAVPRPGWRFVRWDGPCGHLSEDNNCRFDVASLWVVFWDRDYGEFPIPASTAVFEAFDGETDYNGAGSFSESGNAIYAGDAAFSVPPNGVLDSIQLSAAETSTPITLPSGLRQVGDVFTVDISEADQERLNAPYSTTLTYADADVIEEDDLLPLLYTDSGLEPVTVTAYDTTLNTITFESRRAATIVLAEITSTIPSSYDTGFVPFLNSFDIDSSGGFYAPGGNAFGMAGYAAWHFDNQTASLDGRFSADVSEKIATRVQLAQGQSWGRDEWRRAQNLDNDRLGRLIKAYLYYTNEPLVLLLKENDSATHAAVVYAYTSNRLWFYDVGFNGQTKALTLIGSNFGFYQSFDSYGYTAVTNFGRDEDFLQLTQEALNEFGDSGDLRIFSPSNGELVSSRTKSLSGFLSGDLSSVNKLHVAVGGFTRAVPVSSGSFRDEIEIPTGETTLVHLGRTSTDTPSNWYPGSNIDVRHIRGVASDTNLTVTLVWDQADIDVDLYVTDPDGETLSGANPETSAGMTLAREDNDGYGPEYAVLADAALSGDYQVRVHYRSNEGTSLPASGRVNIVIKQGAGNQVAKTIPFSIPTSNAASTGATGTGAAWADIATVNVDEGTID